MFIKKLFFIFIFKYTVLFFIILILNLQNCKWKPILADH